MKSGIFITLNFMITYAQSNIRISYFYSFLNRKLLSRSKISTDQKLAKNFYEKYENCAISQSWNNFLFLYRIQIF